MLSMLQRVKVQQQSARVSESRHSDRLLVISTLILVALGVLMVYSTTGVSSGQLSGDSTAFLRRHCLHALLGLLLMFGVSAIDPYFLRRASAPLFLFSLGLLALVLIPGVGEEAGGARRWISLGFITFQPSEIAKLALILFLSAYIGHNHQRMMLFVPGTLVPFSIVLAVSGLLILEPDFGTTVFVCLASFLLMFTVARMGHLVGIGVVALWGLFSLILISPYRFRRFEAFLDPLGDPKNSGYQLVQSLIAVGSGGILGEGLGAGRQKLFYLPEAHTDFIFAVIAEELGLIGASLVALLFVLIAVRGIAIARRLSTDRFLSSLALGATLLIVLPALLNMFVVLGMLPTKGMVLPLISYGGSALLMNLATIGVLIRLSRLESVKC